MTVRSIRSISSPRGLNFPNAFFALLLCFVSLIHSEKPAANIPSADDFKAVIIHKVIQLTTWPNEQHLKTFEIGVYGGSSSYISNLNKNYRNRNIRGKALQVSKFNPYKDKTKISILFVKDNKSDEIADIAQALKGKSILIISDASKDKRHVMVNLTRPSKKEIGFEINRSNIIIEGLQISKDVVLAGGSELDVAKIYRETATDLTKTKQILTDKEKKLKEQSQRLEVQSNQLVKQSKEIREKSTKLENLEVELKKQLKTIEDSSNILKNIENKLKTSKDSLVKRETENTTLTQKIRDNIKILEEQKRTLAVKDAELVEKETELSSKSEELDDKVAELNVVSETVEQQETTIATQKQLIIASAFAVFMISLLGIIAYRSYIAKKKSALVIEEKNKELEEAITELNLAQEHLIQSEKMASLGGMVAGIAHEVNTPTGIVLTADSSLLEKTLETQEKFKDGTLTQAQFADYLDHTIECTELSLSNIRRMASIIQTFKQVAVDQSSNEQRQFVLSKYVDDVIQSLHPVLQKAKSEVQVNCPSNIVLFSYPGVFAQILNILISNSLDHGFREVEQGRIKLNFTEKDDYLFFTYEDNGIGATEEVIKNIFDPFYTTKRGEGNSGLGAHILYNLVTQLLKGKVKCQAGRERGLNFEFVIPEKLAAS